MSIKLICIDMDGTLLVNDHDISEENKQAVMEAVNKGIHVAITTGRIYNCAKLYSESIGLKTAIISSNGAFIGDMNGNEIYKNPLSLKEIKDIETIAKKYNFLFYLTANFGLISTEELPENNLYKVLNKSLKEEDKVLLKVVKDMDEAYNLYPNDLLKAMCICKGNMEDLAKARQELHKLNPNLQTVASWKNNFEIMRTDCSQGYAVEKLAKSLNLTRDEVMCIGDSENDLSMIEYSGTGVAMGNALDMVKSAATYITDTNVNSGVAKAINKFVLNK